MDRVQQTRRVTFSAIESEFSIVLALAWEKSISPLGVNGRHHLTAVTDDTGASLLPAASPAPATPQRVTSYIRTGQGLSLSGLRVPSAQAKKLSRVEGTVEVEFPSRIDEVRFDLASEGATPPKEKSIEGATVEFKGFVPQAAWGATMTVAVHFADPKEGAKFRIGQNDVEYVMPGDQKRFGWIATASYADGVYTFVTNWRNGGRTDLPKEVRLRIPRGVVVKNVPFCFKDVELK